MGEGNMYKKYIFFLIILCFSAMPFTNIASANFENDGEIDGNLRSTIVQELPAADVSMVIRNLEGQIIFNYNGDRSQKPASNLKLFTAAAALSELGENYRFKTNVFMDGIVKKGVLQGDLYLQGKGDPTLSMNDLKELAAFLHSQGLKKINGRIVADDFYFDQKLLTPHIEKEDQSYYYAAPVTALMISPNKDYDAASVLIEAKGNKEGKKPTLHIEPAKGELLICNEAKTVAYGQPNTLKIEREFGTRKVYITGNLPREQTVREWIAVPQPTKQTMTLFKEALKSQQVDYTDTTFYRAVPPKNAHLIAQKQSVPLKDIMIPYMKLSNNSISNVLVKTLGKEVKKRGSTPAGLKTIKKYAASAHIPIKNAVLDDGSGLSQENRLTAEDLTELLYKIYKDEKWFNTYFNSLPIAGKNDRLTGGSLQNRLTSPLTNGRVFAKTGSIESVNTLSGYFIGQSGKMYIFSLLVENQEDSVEEIDHILTEAARVL